VSGIHEVFSLAAVSVLRRHVDRWETLAWAGDQELKAPDQGSEVIDLTRETVLVLLDGKLTGDDRMVLRAFAAQIVLALEREDLEREAAAADAMLATDRLRTALLNAVSHDLRTPLATIKASLTSLLETGVDWTPGETRLFLEEAVDQVGRLNRMVGRLLDASRLQAGAVHVFYRPVSLDEVVSAALAGLGHGSEQVTVDIPESLSPVQTDSDLLERVLANLIENALTWSPSNENVTVDASEITPGLITLRISDRGPGIPAAAREFVVQPFQRVGRVPAKEGVGLGLSVSRGLLDAMGNELAIEDTPGGGTTIAIEFRSARLAEPSTRVGSGAAHV